MQIPTSHEPVKVNYLLLRHSSGTSIEYTFPLHKGEKRKMKGATGLLQTQQGKK